LTDSSELIKISADIFLYIFQPVYFKRAEDSQCRSGSHQEHPSSEIY